MPTNTTPAKRLLLIDGSSYLFRAYNAMPALTTSQGHPTGAIRGIINMLQKTIQTWPSDYIAVVFDAKGKTFRNDLYEQYKANRPPMPDELQVQIKPIHAFIQAMGLPLIIIPGVEADDVIGTLAIQAQQDGVSTWIATNDKDMAQLLNPSISCINTVNNTCMDVAGATQKFGVRPDQMIDYLALIGDTSDNIPGVPKVGPKTAARWLKKYQTLQSIMDQAEQFSGKVGDYLRQSLSFLPLAQQLTRIKTDVVLDITPQELRTSPPEKAKLQSLIEQFEFNPILEEKLNNTLGATPPRYLCILAKSDFLDWVKRLRKARQFALDTETDRLDYMQAQIVGLSFAIQPGQAIYIPVGHDYPGVPDQLDRQWVLNTLKPLLEDKSLWKIGQNIKFDMQVLANYGIHLKGIRHDTMLESYVLNSVATQHNLDALAEKYLGVKTTGYETVAGKGAKQIPFNQVTLQNATPYAAEDADITLGLHKTLSRQLQHTKPLLSLLQDIEIPLIPVLSNMERNGVLIDSRSLQQQSRQLATRLLSLEKQVHQQADQPFNLSSPQQLQHILFEKLKLPVIKKTGRGQPSTAEGVLQELAKQNELPALILEHRSLNKLKTTYTDKLPLQVNPHTGRVHTSYQQAVAATGRLSSTHPNLQNIPIRTESGRRIRQAFIAPPDCILMAADYSQIELRIMAYLSEDEGLIQAFQRGEDIHRATAAEVFGLSEQDVGNDERRAAKAINFGLIYGMSAFGLAKQLDIEHDEAHQYIDTYFEKYPGVKHFMQRTRQAAEAKGYVETLYGRRLYLPAIQSRHAPARLGAERAAINAPMQGSAADIIKRAMIAVHNWITTTTPPVKMIMQVHDELVFEIEHSAADEITKTLAQLMCQAAQPLSLVVDTGIGHNWDEAH